MAQWPLWLCRRATLGEAACVVSPPAIPALGLPLGAGLCVQLLTGLSTEHSLSCSPNGGFWGCVGPYDVHPHVLRPREILGCNCTECFLLPTSAPWAELIAFAPGTQ